jgi:hypothetical protein
VTLESWRIFDPTRERLNGLAKTKLIEEGLPVEWLETMPFIACDISEFEYLIQAIQKAGDIKSVLHERAKSDELIRYELYTYLTNNQSQHLVGRKQFFPNQFEKTFL